MFLYEVYSSRTFTSIYTRGHHPHQDIKLYFKVPRSTPIMLQPVTTPSSSRVITFLTFYHHRLALSALELHVHGIILHTLVSTFLGSIKSITLYLSALAAYQQLVLLKKQNFPVNEYTTKKLPYSKRKEVLTHGYNMNGSQKTWLSEGSQSQKITIHDHSLSRIGTFIQTEGRLLAAFGGMKRTLNEFRFLFEVMKMF